MCDFFRNNSADIWVAFIGAFFGFGLALVIEYIIRNINGKQEKRKANNEIDNKVHYYCLLLEEVVSKTEECIEITTKHIEQQAKNTLAPLPLKRIPLGIFHRLKGINNERFFDALSEKLSNRENWVKEYSDLNSYIDFIDEVLNVEFRRINKRTMNKAYEDMVEVKRLIDSIPDTLSREAFFKTEQLGNNSDNEEYKYINSAILKYRELTENRATFDIYNKEYLLPILETINQFSTQEYNMNVTFTCKQARMLMTCTKDRIQQTLSTYQQMIESLQEPLDEVKKIIEVLKKQI